jgi:hypothetical protein
VTRSFITLVAFIVTTRPAQSPRFVPGEVLTRFVAGSEASAAALRAAETQPMDLSGLVTVVDELGAQVGVPLRPARMSGGNFCVLSVNAEQLGERLRRQLGTRRTVRQVQVVREPSQAVMGPSSIRLLLEFTPASDEFNALSGKSEGGRLARLVASLERDVGVPLKGQVVEPSRLALQVDLEALTLRLVERLRTQSILESVQPNYILEGFIR